MVADGHLLLVLHKVPGQGGKAPQHGKREREGVFFWRKPDGDWEYSGRGSGLRRLVEHIQEYSAAEEKFSLADEQAVDAEDYMQILEKVAPLHHATKNLHAALQAAREGIPHDRDLIDMRDWAYELERELDLLYMDAKNALDFQIARQAEEQARLGMRSLKVANRLNLLAAMFFPVTAISSVFGMNLASGFEGQPASVFWSVLLFGIALGSLVSWWALRGMQSSS
jgi:Mg2+ and Co2+ transporter CorA